ncbi:MAG: 7-cyano-7-deazaguanine synthase [Tepidisphaerales bacterium]
MAKDLAIVLNNGSLNSAVITTLAAQKYRPITVYADLGATPVARFRAAYDQQVAHFKPYREHTLAMSQLGALRVSGGSSASNIDPRQQGLLAPQLVDLLPVLFAAATIAVHYQAGAIYIGLRVGAAPDDLAQATEYVQICNELLQLPCGQPELELQAPLLELEPWQVVDVGFQVGAPLEKGWSCAENNPEPCGVCRGCRARESAFQTAGKPDPLRPVKKT